MTSSSLRYEMIVIGCVLCLLAFAPNISATNGNLVAQSSHSLLSSNDSPLVKYKIYNNLTLTALPKDLKIDQTAGSDCASYPVCGNGTTTFSFYNKGPQTFTTDGNCVETISPAPEGEQSENNCDGSFPLFHVFAGYTVTVYWTIYIYNWPNGHYKITFNFDGTVGTSPYVYQTKNVTFDLTVSGGS
jgi:hypothetical protein